MCTCKVYVLCYAGMGAVATVPLRYKYIYVHIQCMRNLHMNKTDRGTDCSVLFPFAFCSYSVL